MLSCRAPRASERCDSARSVSRGRSACGSASMSITHLRRQFYAWIGPARSRLPLPRGRLWHTVALSTATTPEVLGHEPTPSPPGRAAARRGAGAARVVRDAAVHLLELHHFAAGARRIGRYLGPGEDPVPVLGRVRG